MPPLLPEREGHSNIFTTGITEQIVLRRASYVKIQDLASPHNIDLNLISQVIQQAKEAVALENQKAKKSTQGEEEQEDVVVRHNKMKHTPSIRRPRQDSDASSISVSGHSSNKHQRQSTSSEGYNLCLLVGNVDVVVDKQRVDRSRVRLAEVVVGDETGSMSLRARDDQIDLLQKISRDSGAVVLRNCTVELYQGRHLRLAITKWGKLCCYPDNVQSTPDPPKEINREVNLSQVDLYLMEDAINEIRSSISSTNPQVNMYDMGVDPNWFVGSHTGRDLKHHNQYNMKKNYHGRRHGKKYSEQENLMMQNYALPYYGGDENMMIQENSYSNYYNSPRGYLPSNQQRVPNNQNRNHTQRRQGRHSNNNKRQTDVLMQQQLRQMQMQQIYFQEQHQQRMYYQHQQQIVIPSLMQGMSLDSGVSGSKMNVENQYQTNPSGLNLNATTGFQRMDANSTQLLTAQSSHQHQSQSQQQSHATMQMKYGNPSVQESHLNPYDGTLQMPEPTSPHNQARHTPSQQQTHSNVAMQRSPEWHEINSHVTENNSKSSNQHQNALMQPPPHQVQQNQYGYYAYPPTSQIYGSSPIYGQNMMYMIAPPNAAGGSTGNVPPNIMVSEVNNTIPNENEVPILTSSTSSEPPVVKMKMSYAEKAAQKDDSISNLTKSSTSTNSNIE